MPASRKERSGDRGWTEAIWEWAGDLAKATGCSLQVSLVPTRRAGVFRVSVRALDVADGRLAGVRAQKGGEWPNADRVELLAYVHRLVVALDAELAQDELRRVGP